MTGRVRHTNFNRFQQLSQGHLSSIDVMKDSFLLTALANDDWKT